MGKYKAEKAQSLSQLAGAIGSHLQRLDLEAAAAFLSEVSRKIEPLRESCRQTQSELRKLADLAAGADDVAELRAVDDRLVDLASELFLNLHSAPLVHEACTQVRGAIAARALELARLELQRTTTACDLPMALFSTGSDGRREQSLFADQAYFFVYGGGETDAEPFQEEAVDSYFERLGSMFSANLDEAGIHRRSGGIMPFHAEWRGSKQQWQRRVRGMVRYANGEWTRNMLDLVVLSDARYLAGDLELGQWFGPFVHAAAQNTPEAIVNMARVAGAMPLANGLLRRFAVEGEGKHKGELNLKLLAWKPLVICVEVLAVSFGIEETPTLERLYKLRAQDNLSPKLASELESAFHMVSGLRIMQQIKKHKGLIEDDDYLNPYELEPAQSDELSRSIGSIDELQRLVRSKFMVG